MCISPSRNVEEFGSRPDRVNDTDVDPYPLKFHPQRFTDSSQSELRCRIDTREGQPTLTDYRGDVYEVPRPSVLHAGQNALNSSDRRQEIER